MSERVNLMHLFHSVCDRVRNCQYVYICIYITVFWEWSYSWHCTNDPFFLSINYCMSVTESLSLFVCLYLFKAYISFAYKQLRFYRRHLTEKKSCRQVLSKFISTAISSSSFTVQVWLSLHNWHLSMDTKLYLIGWKLQHYQILPHTLQNYAASALTMQRE